MAKARTTHKATSTLVEKIHIVQFSAVLKQMENTSGCHDTNGTTLNTNNPAFNTPITHCKFTSMAPTTLI
jgi:hypothetical protein